MSQICTITFFSYISIIFYEFIEQNSGPRKESAWLYSAYFPYSISVKWDDVSYYYPIFRFIFVIVRTLKLRKLTSTWDTEAVRLPLAKNIPMYLYTRNILGILPLWGITECLFLYKTIIKPITISFRLSTCQWLFFLSSRLFNYGLQQNIRAYIITLRAAISDC